MEVDGSTKDDLVGMHWPGWIEYTYWCNLNSLT
jgi:hypothetical protein